MLVRQKEKGLQSIYFLGQTESDSLPSMIENFQAFLRGKNVRRAVTAQYLRA